MSAISASCKWCGQEFSSKTRCEKHSKSCTPFACGHCDEKFKSKNALHEHAKKHRPRFQCDLCDTPIFKTSGLLEQHRAHVHEIPIKCSACDKIFKLPFVRDRHYETQHSDNPKFVCPCGLKFACRTHSQSHEETCVLSKRGATTAIKRRFEELSADTSDRNGACTQAFSEIRQGAKKRLECKCAECGLCLQDRDSLKRHVRKQHKGSVESVAI